MPDHKKLIALGADLAGFRAKTFIKSRLQQDGYHCIDLGPYQEMPGAAAACAEQLGHIVQEGAAEWGILVCGREAGPAWRRELGDERVLHLESRSNSDEQNMEVVNRWLRQIAGERREPDPGKKLVFANGVFDVLHSGHIQLLKFARSRGDRLIVGLNSDRSVKALKGPSRPINCEADRKAILEALRYVDEVIIFDEDRPTRLIHALNPNVVVKGGQWPLEEVRERDKIPQHIELVMCPIRPGYSSTNIIEHLQEI
jgi:rfaE bifunctional protein nucleotidyltransferase chain/domain